MNPETAAVVLNVDANSSVDVIQAAYRRRARLLHPDRLAGAPQGEIDEATREFSRINEARDVLINYASRPAPPPPRSCAWAHHSSSPSSPRTITIAAGASPAEGTRS